MKRYVVRATKQYRKDVKRLTNSGYDRQKLEAVIDLLASGITLPDRYRDHPLHGALEGRRECHIAPDWLLLYRKDDDQFILLLLSTGTHRDVLGIE